MCGKSATNRLPALAGCQQVLVGPRSFSDQQHAPARKLSLRQAFRKKLRRVKAAFGGGPYAKEQAPPGRPAVQAQGGEQLLPGVLTDRSASGSISSDFSSTSREPANPRSGQSCACSRRGVVLRGTQGKEFRPGCESPSCSRVSGKSSGSPHSSQSRQPAGKKMLATDAASFRQPCGNRPACGGERC